MSSEIVQTVLMIVLQKDHLLMIEKKRGLNQKFLNLPGGKVEPYEKPMEAAIRECYEETGIWARRPKEVALLEFKFQGGVNEKTAVFMTSDYDGMVSESDEAIPYWNPLQSIPYDRMWESDRIWLKAVLEGQVPYQGTFEYDSENRLLGSSK